jgi:hypothetical protein
MDTDAHGFFKMKMMNREPREIRERIFFILFSCIWRISRLRIRQKIKATTFSKRARLKVTMKLAAKP